MGALLQSTPAFKRFGRVSCPWTTRCAVKLLGGQYDACGTELGTAHGSEGYAVVPWWPTFLLFSCMGGPQRK